MKKLLKTLLRGLGWCVGCFLIAYGIVEGALTQYSIMRPTSWLEQRIGAIPTIITVFLICFVGAVLLLYWLNKTRPPSGSD